MPSDKDLLQKHPLFTRLSGQIVWYLFEERGYEPELIDGFMQRFERLKSETAELMRRARDPANQGGVLVIERSLDSDDASGAPCALCTALENVALALDAPQLEIWLPPFSLGCRLRGRVVPPGAGLAPTPESRLPQPPVHLLVCEDEWIFARPWPACLDE
jgi:hypothetical protein